MSSCRLEIPRSLADRVRASNQPVEIEIVAAPPTASGKNLRVLPARIGAMVTGWLVAGDVGAADFGGRYFVVALGPEEPVVRLTRTAEELVGTSHFKVVFYDDVEGKGQRRKELMQAGGTRLANAEVGLIGLGSLGSTFYNILVRNGFLKFAGVDDDRVEGHNATKSLVYAAEHVGFLKTDALANWGRSVEPALSFRSFPRRFDAAFVQQDGAAFLAGLSLVYVSANNISAINGFVQWFDRLREQGQSLPLVLVQLVFENARASILAYWDPQNLNAPCPGCFFAMNPAIYDASMEDIDAATYSPVRVTNSTPQVAGDIAHHVAMASSYAIALLTGSAERLEIVARKPWLYTFALRGAAKHLDWTSTEHAGGAFLWPTFPGNPFQGCACCRAAGRVRAAGPQFPERRRSSTHTKSAAPLKPAGHDEQEV